MCSENILMESVCGGKEKGEKWFCANGYNDAGMNMNIKYQNQEISCKDE